VNVHRQGVVNTLNSVYSSLSSRRRYEVWFLRLAMADGSGAWWFRYMLVNPGRSGCGDHPQAMPVQVWATWFPCNAKPQTWIQGWSLQDFQLSRRSDPFHFQHGANVIEENFCRGALRVDGHDISWNLQYSSTFHTTLSSKGWIGFSRTPHSDAVFFGHIALDGRRWESSPLGFGLQGHNCGYRHRTYWTWAHAFFSQPGGQPSTLEALIYDMPFGLVFRRSVLWHKGKEHVFSHVRERISERCPMNWCYRARSKNGLRLDATLDGSGPALHVLPYVKTDCSGTFEVSNNSLARAVVCLQHADGSSETLETKTGAVLEMGGQIREISK
jgi:hypothetical protein